MEEKAPGTYLGIPQDFVSFCSQFLAPGGLVPFTLASAGLPGDGPMGFVMISKCPHVTSLYQVLLVLGHLMFYNNCPNSRALIGSTDNKNDVRCSARAFSSESKANSACNLSLLL